MNKNKNTDQIKFPTSIIAPVAEFLRSQLSTLEVNKKKVEEADPFKNESRTTDNAALDTEAEEQFGHAMTSAMKSQLTRRIIQTRKALGRVKIGKYGICEDCGNIIDTDRLMVYPEATRCIKCEQKKKQVKK